MHPSRWRGLLPWLGTAARLVLGVVFVVAGATKVGDLAASGRAVNAYQLMPFGVAKAVGAALPFVEIVVGLLLIVGLATRVVAVLTAALLVVYIVGISSAWARGLTIDCGCFSKGGELGAGQHPAYTVGSFPRRRAAGGSGPVDRVAEHPFCGRRMASWGQ